MAKKPAASRDDVKPTHSSDRDDKRSTPAPDDVPYTRFRAKVKEVNELKKRLQKLQSEKESQGTLRENLNEQSARLASYASAIDPLVSAEETKLKALVGEEHYETVRQKLAIKDISPVEKLAQLKTLGQIFGDMQKKFRSSERVAGLPIKNMAADPLEALRRKLQKGLASPREKKIFLKSLRTSRRAS